MRLADDVCVIGGGRLGYGLSSDYDCNVFAVDDGDSVVLIDAGSGLGEQAILKWLRQDGIAGRVAALVLTHAHADHAGGACGLRERLGIPVLASAATADIVESGDEERLGLRQARKDGVYPESYRFKPCRVDRVLAAGDTIRHGSHRLQVVPAPGHSSDMIALYDAGSGTLFGGDAIFAGGRLAVLNTEDFSMHDYRDTIVRLAALKVRRLFAGHLEAVLQGAQACLLDARDRFERGEAPLSIV
ncbi:MBL fold metallo-hydrolase [Gordoniibacillus kamchatkensis]|uniref:MBL fold metallo-hydrolase n=1 Tax=Gordoniibacillus kamchatkensis TaxID=1590651 RepID=UPI000698F74D|nr:MBL fold metallo-hydrolase [Paenibacillus sp. VKM B-2647]